MKNKLTKNEAKEKCRGLCNLVFVVLVDSWEKEKLTDEEMAKRYVIFVMLLIEKVAKGNEEQFCEIMSDIFRKAKEGKKK